MLDPNIFTKGKTLMSHVVASWAGGPGRMEALALRDQIEKEFGITSVLQEDGSLQLLTDAEALEYAKRSRIKHVRGLFRATARVKDIDSGNLTEAQKAERDHVERVNQAAAKAASKASRDPVARILRKKFPTAEAAE